MTYAIWAVIVTILIDNVWTRIRVHKLEAWVAALHSEVKILNEQNTNTQLLMMDIDKDIVRGSENEIHFGRRLRRIC